MVPPTVNGISLLHLVSAVVCSVALNLQFERPCFLCPYHMHLSADAELLADFVSCNDLQLITYREVH